MVSRSDRKWISLNCLSNRLGVSPQRIRRLIKRLPRHATAQLMLRRSNRIRFRDPTEAVARWKKILKLGTQGAEAQPQRGEVWSEEQLWLFRGGDTFAHDHDCEVRREIEIWLRNQVPENGAPPLIRTLEASNVAMQITSAASLVLNHHRSFLRQLIPVISPDPLWMTMDAATVSMLTRIPAFYLESSREAIIPSVTVLIHQHAKKGHFIDWRFAIFLGLVVSQFHGFDTGRCDYDATFDMISGVRDGDSLSELCSKVLPLSPDEQRRFKEFSHRRNVDYPLDVDRVIREARRNRLTNERIERLPPRTLAIVRSLEAEMRSGEKLIIKKVAAKFKVSRATFYRLGWARVLRDATINGPAAHYSLAEVFAARIDSRVPNSRLGFRLLTTRV